eukprot:s711_g2.t1
MAMFTATDITIPEGVFCQPDGSPLRQLQVRNLTPNSKGIVVLSEAEIQPYLPQKSISKEGLAMLVLAPFTEAMHQYGEQIRFPAQCIQTGEPVLLNAIIVQKGQMPVRRSTPATPIKVDTVTSQTIKVLAYRDELTGSWADFADRPVKAILDALPCLKVCKVEGCSCECWHPSSDMPEPILDIWQRDFLTIHFRKSKQREASLFTCMFRLTADAFAQISSLSGIAGIYLETRTPDGKGQDPEYHTVWLNKSSLQEARAFQTTTAVETSLVRVSNRFGLRVKASEAKQLHDIIRPDVPFLGGTAKTTWLVGPVPFGTTRKGLHKLFATWDWEAKPLQPAGPSADKSGLRWQVVSNAPPPNYVYTLEHGDVLIVKSEPHEIKPQAMAQVKASATSCKAVSTAMHTDDPWAAWYARSPQPKNPTATAAPSNAQMAAIENSLEQRLLKKFQPNGPDTDMQPDYDPRISALEARVNQIQADQKQLHTQQGVIGQKVEHISQQMDSHTTNLRSHLDERLNDQMQRIEALLSKRPRQE